MNILRSTSRINDMNFFYEIIGEGNPLILIHSEFTDHRIWDFQVKEFAQHFQVIRYDVRGFGKSDAPSKTTFYYKDLHELMKFIKIEKAFLFGASLGGEIAIDFTLQYPDMVQALILSGSSISGYEESSEDEGSRKRQEAELSIIRKDEKYEESIDYLLNSPIWKQEKSFIQSYLKDIFMESSLEWMLKDNVKKIEPPAINRLSEIKIPTLIIKGERDSQNSLEESKILEKSISNSKTITINGTGKLPNLDKPTIFNQIVLDFLLELSNGLDEYKKENY